MKKLLNKVKAWLHDRRVEAAMRREVRRQRHLERESRRVLQVCEFGGEVYLSFGGTPVMPADGLKWDMHTSLEVARQAYILHREESGREVTYC